MENSKLALLEHMEKSLTRQQRALAILELSREDNQRIGQPLAVALFAVRGALNRISHRWTAPLAAKRDNPARVRSGRLQERVRFYPPPRASACGRP